MPEPSDERIGGVNGVVSALVRHLPKHGIKLVSPAEAQIVHGHALARWNPLDCFTIHGIYPEPCATQGEAYANQALYHNLLLGRVITAPARWILPQLAHMGREIQYIPNGVDIKKIAGAKPRGYALFGKSGKDGVVKDGMNVAQWLAEQRPNNRFVFLEYPGKQTPNNVRVVGRLPYPKMQEALANASIYIATTLECHSLQVMEAMSYGVPVVGIRQGGTAETIPHNGIGGILVDHVVDLPLAFDEAIARHDEIGRAGKEWVAANYQWGDIIPLYVRAYGEALELKKKQYPLGVSVVITCHNLEKYIGEAIESAINQDFQSKEVIVVDDGSTDGSWQVISKYRGIKAYRREEAHGAGDARNFGIERGKGKYIVCLDGDDRLHNDYLRLLVPLLEGHPERGIAYAAWENIGESSGVVSPQPWDFRQLIRGNYIGCASLFRREAWERVGGYKNINPSWEDYDLWLSIGEARYEGVMYDQKTPLWDYRVKGREGRNYTAQPEAPRLRATVNAWHPRLYKPTISVIIPCYGYENYVGEAIQSVLAQTYQDFEIIVVDDGSPGNILKALEPFIDEPRVRLVRQTNKGLGAARNAGIAASRGAYILPLDADDKLDREFLWKVLEELRKGDGIIYTDLVAFDDEGHFKRHELPDYDYRKMLTETGMMFCTCLYPKLVWLEVGGYPEDAKGEEDYTFWAAAGARGWHGRRIAGYYGWWYRQHGDGMHNKVPKHDDAAKQRIWGRLKDAFVASQNMEAQNGLM